MQENFQQAKFFDAALAVSFVLLLAVGVVMMYSTSLGGSYSIYYKQLAYAIVAIGLFAFFSYFDYKILERIATPFYFIIVALLATVLKFGYLSLGARRWFNLGLIDFQPSELAKLALILLLARFFASRRGEIKNWQNIVLSFLYALVPIILIVRQPDLGSAIILFMIWLGILLVSRVQKKVFIYLFIGIVLVSAGAWKFGFHDYQKHRIETFLNPQLDPEGRGYNVQQAIIAVGSGGIHGTGLGKGLQSQLKFLPERQTDFVFASAAEELGTIGTVVIILLYCALLYRLLIIYRNSRDDTGRFMVAGIFFFIFSQAAINIGMNVGLLPVTGIPLPLVSYGGSSLLSTAIALGITESIAMRSKGLRL
jgi:rod shape determining protein RodA